MSKSAVVIVLVGDEKVGKSTLIQSVLSEGGFPERVPPVVPVVDIPAEMTADGIPVQIVDTSSKQPEDLEKYVAAASVICLLYSADQPSSFSRISSYWLPQIRKIRAKLSTAPILLVGTKIDLREKEGNEALEKMVTPIMNEFKEVETCIECSAKGQINVGEVFAFAQKAVIYPTAPLFDPNAQRLKPACTEALKRIFDICDKDKDGILNDYELNQFQKRCFGSELAPTELQGVKDVVSNSVAEGLKSGGLTYVGFLFLHHLFVQKGRLETSWTVLRAFGYTDNLTLDPDFLVPKLDDVGPGKVVELAKEGVDYLDELFVAFTKDAEKPITSQQLDSLFSTAIPSGSPWKSYIHQLINKTDLLSLNQYRALWSMTTLHSYETTVKYLAYLGCPDHSQAFIVKSGRKEDLRRKRLSRTTLQGYVLGASGSGKTSLIDRLANPTTAFSDQPKSTGSNLPPKAVGANLVAGKTLVLMEFPNPATAKSLVTSSKEMDLCDVVVLVFDATDAKSVEAISETYTKLQETSGDVPVVVVGTKKDLSATTDAITAATNFCKTHLLGEPIIISLREETDAVFTKIVSTATQDFLPEPAAGRGWGQMGLVALGLAVVGGAGYFLYTKLRGSSSSSK